MEHQTSNRPNHEFNWVKKLYFYTVFAVTLFIIGVSGCVLIYSSAIRFVFTDLQNKPYISYEECKNNFNYYDNSFPPVMPYPDNGVKIGSENLPNSMMAPTQPTPAPQLNNDEKKACADKRKSIEYQQVALSTGLSLLISGIILAIHLALFRNKK